MIISAKLPRLGRPGMAGPHAAVKSVRSWCPRFLCTTDNPVRGRGPQRVRMRAKASVRVESAGRWAHVRRATVLALALTAVAGPAAAQSFEAAGTRAMSMGGAFTAVSDDATATWWNPAGLAGGALFSTVLERGLWGAPEEPVTGGPGTRDQVSGIALTYPAMGLSYYRFRVSEVGQFQPIGAAEPGRQVQGLATPLARSLAVSAFGITVGQSVGEHIVLASTIRLLRAGVVTSTDVQSPGILDRAQDLAIDAQTKGDIDLGVMLRFGMLSLGGTVKHVGEPGLGRGSDAVILRRQGRAGLALTKGKSGVFDSLIGAVDLDLTTNATVFGDERRLAAGGEVAVWRSRVLLRGGLSTNTQADDRRWQRSAGASVAVRKGVYVDSALFTGNPADAPVTAADARTGWSVSLRTAF